DLPDTYPLSLHDALPICMRSRPILAAGFAMICFAIPAVPWNATGHRIIASIAYDNLTPAARARVDDLIRRHPDYESLFLKDASRSEEHTSELQSRSDLVC